MLRLLRDTVVAWLPRVIPAGPRECRPWSGTTSSAPEQPGPISIVGFGPVLLLLLHVKDVF